MDLNTPISLVCSNRLADMLADKAKKHKNIVKAMITLNVILRMCWILSSVAVLSLFVYSGSTPVLLGKSCRLKVNDSR